LKTAFRKKDLMKSVLQVIVAAVMSTGLRASASAAELSADAEVARPQITAEEALALIARLASEEIDEAAAAADELAQAGNAALPFLVSAAHAKEEAVRRRVAAVLGRINGPEALPTLYVMLKDESDAVRREAICAVGNHRQAESTGRLGEFLLDKNPLLRMEAAMALGRIGDVKTLAVLKRSCLDDDPRVRKAAVVALGLFGHRSGIPVLISSLEDENKTVRKLAHLVLKTLCDTDFEFDPDGEEKARSEAVKLWKTWWKTHSKSDTGGNTRKEKENKR